MDLADNTIVYDGTIHSLDYVNQERYHEELTYVYGATNETDSEGNAVLAVDGIHIRPGMWNTTIDLSSFTEMTESATPIVISGSVNVSFLGGNGVIDGVRYEENICKSCVFTVQGNNDGTPITITLDAELINGKVLQMKLVTSSDQN